MVLLAFFVGVVLGGVLGYTARLWLGGRTNVSTSPGAAPSAPLSVPPVAAGHHLCALVDVNDRVISYRQVRTVPPEFFKYHGRGANSRFVRDGEDAAGRPRFRLVG